MMLYNKDSMKTDTTGMSDSLFMARLYGQERLKKEWSRLLADGRLPHTMIFYGDEGLGKTTAALSLAEALMGEKDAVWKEADSWFSDPAAVKDVPVLTAADGRLWYLRPLGMELKMEQFRTFLDAMASFDDARRVCIIDEAQTMMDPVANAILKTLEEPGPAVYFILITHDVDALLPTIISRAARFAFSSLSEKDYMACLRDHKRDFPFASDEERKEAFLLSEGNPGLTKDMFADGDMPQPESAMDFWSVLTRSRTPFSDLTPKVPQDRKAFLKMLQWITLVGRDLLVLSATGKDEFVRCRKVAEQEKELVPSWKAAQADRALEVLEAAENACRRYISVKNIWDMVLIRLLRIQRDDIWNK